MTTGPGFDRCPSCGHGFATTEGRLRCSRCGDGVVQWGRPFVPARLVQARAVAGLRRDELAARVRLTPAELLAYERGDACPVLDVLADLAHWTGFGLELFFEEPPRLGPMLCERPSLDSLPGCVGCGMPAERLCDARAGIRRCDAPICVECAVATGPNRDLCPEHARAAAAAGQNTRVEPGRKSRR